MSEASASLANTLADRYTIERLLGQGGMATVHLAEERKRGRRVPINIVKQDSAASLGAELFLRELGIAARLSHPHIVPLIDSGESDGALYYVSPYIQGGSLRDRLNREKKLPIDDALRIASEVGAGLDYAHRNGFVHRDVKPENILFADDHALLADFGIAHVASSTVEEPITIGGFALGTPEYMSPEQASGETDIGVPGDVYGLACVFYEMLAGEPPFKGPTPRATMAKQVTERARPLRILRPDAPVGFERVLEKALAKDPEQRFPSIVDFCDALSRARLEPNRAFAATTRTIAVLPFVNSSPDPDNEYLSDGITDELINALAKVDGLRVASRTSVFALKGKAQDVRAIGALLESSEVLEGTVRRIADNLRITAQLTSTDDGRLMWSERYDRKLDDVFAIQDEIARTIVTTLRSTSFANLAPAAPNRHTDNVQAYGLYLRGRYALRAGAPVVRVHAGVAATFRRSANRSTHRARERPVIRLGQAQPRLLLFVRSQVRSGPLSPRSCDRDESDGGRELSDSGFDSDLPAGFSGCRACIARSVGAGARMWEHYQGDARVFAGAGRRRVVCKEGCRGPVGASQERLRVSS